MKTISMLVASALFALASASCVTGTDPDFALDEEAAASGKSDDAYSFTRMDQVAPADFAPVVQTVYGGIVRECFERYRAEIAPDAQLLTKNVAAQFRTIRVGCEQWSTAERTVNGVLDAQVRQRMSPEALIAGIARWITPTLEAVSRDGDIDSSRLDDPTLYFMLEDKRDEMAIARAAAPQGVNLGEVLAQWRQVTDGTTLDNEFLQPVTFPDGAVLGDRIFNYLRAAFPLNGLTLAETRFDAIDGFASADEGPNDNAAFAGISTALRQDAIKKRFYFSRFGEVSSHVLIVVDEHGQAWGFQMGYSE